MSFGERGRWQELYLSVLSESQESERWKKVEAAETEMRRRVSALKRRRDTESILEVQAITTALKRLAPLRGPEPASQMPRAATVKGSGRVRQASE